MSKKTPNPDLKRLDDMTEPELKTHFNKVLGSIESQSPDDVIGSMVITFLERGVVQYAASIDPETAPGALRSLALRIEQRETVKR